MRTTIRVLKYIFLSLFGLTILAPLYINWLTSIISPTVLADWTYVRLLWLQSLYKDHTIRFQVLLVSAIVMPAGIALLIFGGIAAVLDWFLDRRSNVEDQLKKLVDDLSPLLLVYDPDYKLIGRLRQLMHKFDDRKFRDFQTDIYEALYEYCGPDADGKQTFFVLTTPTGEGIAFLSVVNEDVKDELYDNLFNIKACQQAVTLKASQAVRDVSRNRDMIKSGKWALPDCKSLLVSPILIGQEACGVLGVYHCEANSFSIDVDLKFLELLAALLGLAYTIRAKEVAP